jgi:hypothetical protein
MGRHIGRWLPTYWEGARRPLQSLLFLLPLIAVYEMGLLALDHGEADVAARALLRWFFEGFGATGYYLPGLLVAGVLLAIHVARGDPWEVRPGVHALMWAESLIWTLPLLVLALLLFRQPVTQQAATAELGWRAHLVFSLGAGIYEELVFRLVAIAVLHLLCADLLRLSGAWATTLSVGGSALAFALYHFTPPEPFHALRFVFYTAAGLYFAGIYLSRGFGVAAGTHAIYDMIAVALAAHA